MKTDTDYNMRIFRMKTRIEMVEWEIHCRQQELAVLKETLKSIEEKTVHKGYDE